MENEYKIRDFVTHVELTKDNFVRCLNGYLETVSVIDKDITDNLLIYLEAALELGGVDLATAFIDCVRVDILGRHF